jgi:hypothetical protein
MSLTPVYTEPDTKSAVVTTLDVGEFAAVVGVNHARDWVKVDLGSGNTGSHATGWVENITTNVNGPCGDEPVVNP